MQVGWGGRLTAAGARGPRDFPSRENGGALKSNQQQQQKRHAEFKPKTNQKRKTLGPASRETKLRQQKFFWK
jgi:hypothetical protein